MLRTPLPRILNLALVSLAAIVLLTTGIAQLDLPWPERSVLATLSGALVGCAVVWYCLQSPSYRLR